jgi:hypothetical protein
MNKSSYNGNGPQPAYNPDWELVLARGSHTTFWELI